MKLIYCIPLLWCFACTKPELPQTNNPNTGNNNPNNQSEFVFTENGTRWLKGGADDWHFNINALELETKNFKYGLGREFFKALLEPVFISNEQAATYYSPNDNFILLEAQEGAKAYPLDLMQKHEVVNDVVDGHPIMVAYCILADLGAVYSRNYCGQTLSFAVSGYTYSMEGVWDGVDGFVLWDRDTESLWWPLMDRGISGPMKNVRFELSNEFEWSQQNWAYIQANFPEAQVLAPNQTMAVPENFPRIAEEELNCN